MKFYGREKQRKDLHRLFSHEGMQLGLIMDAGASAKAS